MNKKINITVYIVLAIVAAGVFALANCHSAKPSSDVRHGQTVGRIDLPKISEGDQIVSHKAYTLCYDEEHEQARWVAYMLTRERASGQIGRADNFRPDEMVKTGSAQLADYKRSGYSRGHLCPAQDMKWDSTAMSETFLLSNMSPQLQTFNDGIWKKIENRVHSWALQYDTLYIVTGPVLKNGLQTIGESRVSVPEAFYKVVYDPARGKMVGWIVPHENLKTTAPKLAVTVDEVEAATGIDFFPALPDEIENAMEGSYSRDDWNWK